MIAAIIGMLLVAIGIWLIVYIVSEDEEMVDGGEIYREEEIYSEEEISKDIMEMMKELGGDEEE